MSLEEIRSKIPEWAKDTKLNLSTVLSEEGSPGLSQRQIFGIALSSAYALRNQELRDALLTESATVLSDQEVRAAKSAAALMATNNMYYRGLSLAKVSELAQLPAKLRMNAITQHGIEKSDFELYSLAVSILGGCESCVKAHTREVKKAGVDLYGIQSAIKIAAVLNSTRQVLETL